MKFTGGGRQGKRPNSLCLHVLTQTFCFFIVLEQWYCINSNNVKHRAICFALTLLKSIFLMPHVDLIAVGRAPTSGQSHKGNCCNKGNQCLPLKEQLFLHRGKKNIDLIGPVLKRLKNAHIHDGFIPLCFIKPAEVVLGFYLPHVHSIIPCKHSCAS